MLFLVAYLSVFDWNLVWLVEYSDMAKLGLMGVALLSSLLALVISQLDNFYRWISLKERRYGWIVWTVVGLTTLSFTISVYFDFKDRGLGTYHLYHFVSSLLGFLIFWVIFRDHDAWKSRMWMVICSNVTVLALSMGFFGATYGYYVKDVSKQTAEITTNNETFKSAKIVMMLSHHTVFFSEGRVTTVPARDIIKISSEPSPTLLLP